MVLKTDKSFLSERSAGGVVLNARGEVLVVSQGGVPPTPITNSLFRSYWFRIKQFLRRKRCSYALKHFQNRFAINNWCGGVHWSLPKGHIEAGEGAIEAARREISEEAGVDVLEFVRPLGSYERHRMRLDGSDDLSVLKEVEMFLFRTSQEVLAPRDPENPSAQWVAVNDVVDLLTHPKDKEFFKSIVGML